MAWIEGLLRVLLVILVPLWGFAEQHWSHGTVVALYWIQTAASIPVTSALIVVHRRMTHKAGHYATAARSSFLTGSLAMSIPFVIADGLFLAFMAGARLEGCRGRGGSRRPAQRRDRRARHHGGGVRLRDAL